MAERDYDICAHGTIGNRTFTDYGKGVLAERWFLEPFSRDDWSGGFAAFLDGCEEYLRMDAEGAPFDQGTDPERLEDLAVDEAVRGQGVGSELLAAAKRWARNRRLEYLELNVLAQNENAIRLYESQDFVEATKVMRCML